MKYEKDALHSQRDADKSIRRLKELLQQGLSQAEIVETLNDEGYRTIRQKLWSKTNLKQVLWRLRHELKSWYALSSRRCGLDGATV